MDVSEEENSQHVLSLYYTLYVENVNCFVGCVKLYIWSSITPQEIKGKPSRGHIMTSSGMKIISN